MTVPRILIIAGSDSGGGAGIQADIKTVTMLGGHAMTAITAITAQNTVALTAVQSVRPEMVIAQIDAVLADIGADVVKIGMIGDADVAIAVAERLEREPDLPVVVDPVMVASSGTMLADAATVAALDRLMRRATIVTPNVPELSVLTGETIADADGLERAARKLAREIGCAVLGKGGHLPGDSVTDILIEAGGATAQLTAPRVDSMHTHGTGCTLASAIAVGIAEQRPLPQAVTRARDFVRLAILDAPGLGAGHGPMGHGMVRLDLTGSRPTLNQVTLPARDVAETTTFYERLGLRRIVTAPGRYVRFETGGGATLSIETANEIAAGAFLYLECDDLDASVDAARAAGAVIASVPEDRRWGWREARLTDPAGNALCLYEAGPMRRLPPWREG